MLSRIRTAAAQAREKGTLQTIDTWHEHLNTSPPFVLRVLSNISAKKAASNNRDPTGSAPEAPFNPFLPYEPSMYVQELPPDHVLLLNKFNVVPDHTLIVTAHYEEQSSLLTASDFSAVWRCLSAVPGVAFYNAGRLAGASQRHKHVQHIATPGGGVAPFAETIARGARDGVVRAAELGFVHGVVGMRDVRALVGGDGRRAGEVWMQRYTEVLRLLGERVEGLRGDEEAQGARAERQPFAYNLIATREWMMVVPRRKECYEGISVNSLGFVGCLLVRDAAQAELVKRVGGMHVLREVGFAV